MSPWTITLTGARFTNCAGSTQADQHPPGGFQIGRVKALRELFEHRLQKRPAALRSPLTSQQSSEVGRGAQLPGARALAPTPFERLHQASLRIIDVRPRHR